MLGVQMAPLGSGGDGTQSSPVTSLNNRLDWCVLTHPIPRSILFQPIVRSWGMAGGEGDLTPWSCAGGRGLGKVTQPCVHNASISLQQAASRGTASSHWH